MFLLGIDIKLYTISGVVKNKFFCEPLSSLFWLVMECEMLLTDISGQPVGSIFQVPLKMKHDQLSRNVDK
jgi:hypothetical protein